MNTELEETTETTEYTSDVLTDAGETITPTRSPVKAALFDHSVPWAALIIILFAIVGVGLALIASMVLGAQKHEITSTTYNQAGACLRVQSFMIATPGFGEDPVLFAKYQAEHPNEKPIESKINRGCPIPFESNTNH